MPSDVLAANAEVGLLVVPPPRGFQGGIEDARSYAAADFRHPQW